MQKESFSCTTHSRNIDESLIQATEKLSLDLNGRIIQGFDTRIYFSDNPFDSFPSGQRVSFYLHANDVLRLEDFDSHLSRQRGEIELNFSFHSKSFLSSKDEVEIFAKNFSAAISDLNKLRTAGVWLIFRGCRMKSVSCSKHGNDLILTKIIFEDLDALRLEWKDSLSLSSE